MHYAISRVRHDLTVSDPFLSFAADQKTESTNVKHTVRILLCLDSKALQGPCSSYYWPTAYSNIWL